MARPPTAGRPHMPEYGLSDPSDARLLPWSWATDRLGPARNYWISTTRPNGRPHAMPVWGVWIEDVFHFSTATGSRKARNLAGNPYCVIHPESADEAVIVEGVVEVVEDEAALAPFRETYSRKYGMDPTQIPGTIYAVRPRIVFGFIEKAEEFPTTATRWIFA